MVPPYWLIVLLLNMCWVGIVSAKSTATFAYLAEGLNEIKDERQIGIKLWAEELSHSSSVEFQVVPVDTIAELLEMIQAQKIDFLLMSCFVFLEEQKKLANDLDKKIWAIQRSNNLYESFVIFTRQEFAFNGFASLRHKRLSIRGDYLLMNEYLQILTMQTAHLDPEHYFKTVKYINSTSQSVLDVFFNSADVGIVPQFAFDLAIELNPGMLPKLKIVHHSQEEFIPALIFSFKQTSPEVQTIFTKAIQNMQTTPRGRQIIDMYKIHSIQEITFDKLAPLMQFYQQTKQVKASKKYARQTAK